MRRAVRTPRDLVTLIQDLKSVNQPFRVSTSDGLNKTDEQNRLVHRWFQDIATWNGDRTPAEVKADCNLQYGAPILARDDGEWSSAFGYIFSALSHAAKLKAIRVLDIPFTRRMGVKQLTEYMTQMNADYTDAGVPLSHPDDRGRGRNELFQTSK